MTLETRISELRAELCALNNTHDKMVAAKQASDEEFQKRVTQHQNRFQQLVGAIAELERMIQAEAPTENGEVAPVSRLATP